MHVLEVVLMDGWTNLCLSCNKNPQTDGSTLCRECIALDDHDDGADITALFEVPPPTEVKPQEIVDAFSLVAVGDLVAIFELFRTMAPPKDRIDRNLVDQQLRVLLPKKGIKDAKAVIRDWFKVADEDSTLDAAAGVIPETVELPDDIQIDGRELIEDLIAFYDRYIFADRAVHLRTALWTLVTHGMDLFDIMPHLCFRAPDRECGKSTYLALLFETVERPCPSTSITGPGVFRTIDALHPTLLIDEGDRNIERNDELRDVLNAAHMRKLAKVMRLVGDNNEPKWFDSWGPKAFTSIGQIKDDQTASRTIFNDLARKPATVKKDLARMRNVSRAGEGLRSRAAKWVKDNAIQLRSLETPDEIGLAGRTADNWEPLLAIATLIGADIHQEALLAAGSGDEGAVESAGELLLAHFREAFDEAGMPDAMSSKDIATALVDRDDGPWAHYWSAKVAAGDFKSVGAALAWKLKPYGIKATTFRDGAETHRGYLRADLEPVWKAYIRVERPHYPQDGWNNGTPQVDGGLVMEQESEPVPSPQGSDQGGSVVPSDSRGTASCKSCGCSSGLHFHNCPTVSNNTPEV